MSMPGFVFYFRCDNCAAASDHYSTFPFPGTFSSDLFLPAWSRSYKCWSQIELSLSSDRRVQLQANPQQLIAIAASLSSAALTVGVPCLHIDNGMGRVSVTPEPTCPHCGESCDAVFGYPPGEQSRAAIPEIPREELDSTPIVDCDLSVRTRNICYSIGIDTIGKLRDRRDEFFNHKMTTDTAVAEVELWLSGGTPRRV